MGQNKQAPTAEKRTVAHKREYLTEAECEKLLEATKGNRYDHRDFTMLLATWRHGFRASEACDLEWSDIDFGRAEMHIRRAKLGKPAVHPIRGDELRSLRRLQREQEPKSTFVFTTERGGPMTRDALNRMVKRLGDGSKLFGFWLHVHMLRHSCGYKLANDGHDTRLIQDYLGHKSIMSTVRYTELSATKFKDVGR